jgi:zinc transport system substrate-binding protein
VWRAVAVMAAAAAVFALPACRDDGPGAGGRTQVVAAFYPLAEAAERVGGNRVEVTNLTSAGAEPHDLELTSDSVDAIEDADVVVVMGGGFQPAVEDTADDRDEGTLVVLDALPIDAEGRVVEEEEEGEGGEEDGGSADALDPHVWLDPVLMLDVVDAVTAAMIEAEPAGRSAFEANAESFKEQIAALDAEYRTGLETCERRLLVTTHDAFGYLANRYGIEVEGVAGISPDAEPDPDRLAQLADLAREEGVTTIFTEELVSPEIAETLAREAGGLRTGVLSPLEGLSAEERDAGDDYVSIMRSNLDKIRAALGCS